jgi:hypothetical protein
VCADSPALLLESDNISFMLLRSLLSGTLGLRLIESIKTLPKLITNVFKDAYLFLSTAKLFSGSGLALILLDLDKAEIKLCCKAFCVEHKRKATAWGSLGAL